MERSRPPWEERGAGGGRGKGSRGRGLKAGVVDVVRGRAKLPSVSHSHLLFFLRRPLFVTHSLIGICHSGPTLPFEVLIAFLIKL